METNNENLQAKDTLQESSESDESARQINSGCTKSSAVLGDDIANKSASSSTASLNKEVKPASSNLQIPISDSSSLRLTEEGSIEPQKDSTTSNQSTPVDTGQCSRLAKTGVSKSKQSKSSTKTNCCGSTSAEKQNKKPGKQRKTSAKKTLSSYVIDTVQKSKTSRTKITKSLVMESTPAVKNLQRATASTSSLSTPHVSPRKSSQLRKNIPQKFTEDSDQLGEDRETSESTEQSISDSSTSGYVSCLSDLIACILEESKFSLESQTLTTDAIIESKSDMQKDLCDSSVQNRSDSTDSNISHIVSDAIQKASDSNISLVASDAIYKASEDIQSTDSNFSLIVSDAIQKASEDIQVNSKENNRRPVSVKQERQQECGEAKDNKGSIVDESKSSVELNESQSDVKKVSPLVRLKDSSMKKSLNIPILLQSTVLADIVDEVILKTSAELMDEVKNSTYQNAPDDETVKEIVANVLRNVMSDVTTELTKTSSSTVTCYVSDTVIFNQKDNDVTSTHTRSATWKQYADSSNSMECKGVKKRISNVFENLATKVAKRNLLKACTSWIKEKISCCTPCFTKCKSRKSQKEVLVDEAKESFKESSSSNNSSVTVLDNFAPSSRKTPSNRTLPSSSSAGSSPGTKTPKLKLCKKKRKTKRK